MFLLYLPDISIRQGKQQSVTSIDIVWEFREIIQQKKDCSRNGDPSGTYGHECNMKFTGYCPCACMHVCAIMRCAV